MTAPAVAPPVRAPGDDPAPPDPVARFPVAVSSGWSAAAGFRDDAWLRLEANFETAQQNPSDTHARGAMLLGAHLAGAAIEQSMLGAAHACANPLTARFGITHGAAVGLMMPHVVRFNCARGENPYYDLSREPEALVRRLTGLLTAAALPTTLSAYGVAADDLPLLASQAAQQWTAGFNPRALDAAAMLDIYCAAI